MNKNMTVFERIEEIKQQTWLKNRPISNSKIIKIFGRLSHYFIGDMVTLSDDEREIYDFLLKNKLNPKTVYMWFRLLNAPSDIKEKLSKRKISIKNALTENTLRKKSHYNPTSDGLLRDIKKYIGGLKWEKIKERDKRYQTFLIKSN